MAPSAAFAETHTNMKSANKNGQGQCLITPASTKTVQHDAIYKDVTTVTPGKDAVVREDARYKQDIPEVPKLTHDETQFTKTIDAIVEASYDQWRYSLVVPGLEEESHLEYQHSRTNPGQEQKLHNEWRHSREVAAVEEVSKTTYQHTRTNPGQERKAHNEYTYFRDVEGVKEVSHVERTFAKTTTEYQFQTRVKRPDNKVERKFIKGWNFVSGGTVRVNGQTIAGHWVQADGWNAIPDVIINAVWGTGSVPRQYLGGSETNPKGSVNLSMYGGPNKTTVYYAKELNITGGYTDWGPWSAWSSTNPGASNDTRNVQTRPVTTLYKDGAWTTDTPGAPWAETGSRKVVDQAGTEGYREYLKTDGSTTRVVAEADWFKETEIAGWRLGHVREVEDKQYIAPFSEWLGANGAIVTKQSEAAWLPEASIEGWTQSAVNKDVSQEAVPAYTLYRTADGLESRNETDAAWSSTEVIPGWDTYGAPNLVEDQKYIAPFKEWRAADGSAVTDQLNASWFSEALFEGWTQDGQRQVVTRDATEAVTYYVVRGEDGALTTSTNIADATVFTEVPAGLDPSAVEFGREKIVTQDAVPAKVQYLTVDESGVFGVTEDPAEASWIALSEDNGVDLSIWTRVIDQGTNEPIVRTAVDAEEIPGYTVYFVPNGEPTLELGDQNWTTEVPEGWTLVDTRTVTLEEAVLPKTETTQKLVKEAWEETVKTEAKYGDCAVVPVVKKADPKPDGNTLAETGNAPLLPLVGGAAALLLLASGAFALARRKNLSKETA